MKNENTPRGAVLLEAKNLTEGDRNQQHGDPFENLAQAAAVLNAMFGTSFDATDVGLIYTILKMVRIKAGDPNNRDHYVDAAAYMAIAWECQDKIDQGFGPPEDQTFTGKPGRSYGEVNPAAVMNRMMAAQGSPAAQAAVKDYLFRDQEIGEVVRNRRGVDKGVRARPGYDEATDQRRWNDLHGDNRAKAKNTG